MGLKKQLISANLNLFGEQTLSLAKIYIPAFSFIFLVWLTSELTSISVYELVSDPHEVGRIAPYVGIVSNVGLLFFCCTATTCLFTSYLINTNNKQDKKWRLFFQCSGYLLLLLLIDDAFQIHENFSTLLFGVDANIGVINKKLQNILETIVFGLYGFLFCFYGFYFKKLICRTKTLLLIIAFGFLGMSILVDVLPEDLKGHFILEEGFKLLGIVSLMAYYIKVCYQKAKKLL